MTTPTETAIGPGSHPAPGTDANGEVETRRPPEGLTTTVRVHRATRGETPWWHRAVVVDVFRPLDLPGLDALSAGITHVARLGASAVLLHAPDLDPTGTEESAAVARLLRRAHQRGLHVLVGVSVQDAPVGTADPTAWHLARTTQWLDLGVDGVDLVDSHGSHSAGPERRAEVDVGAVHALVAERNEEGIVSGALSAADPQELLTHLREDWWHLTRDDRLATAPWNAAEWRTAITDALTQRDAVGAPMAWTLADLDAPPPPRGWGDLPPELADERWRAASLFVAGLPGAMVLRHGESVGLNDSGGSLAEAVEAVAARASEQAGVPGSRFDRYRKALRLREELHLATGPLSWLGEELDGGDCLAYVNRNVLVALNFGAEDMPLPPHREVLHLSSEPTAAGPLASLPPSSAVWLDL